MLKNISPEVEQQLIDLLNSYEIAMARINMREKALEDQIEIYKNFLDEKTAKLKLILTELKEILTEAGAARLKLSIQEAIKISESQLGSLKKLNAETKTIMAESCTRFEKSASATIKNVHAAITAFKIEDFNHFFESSYSQIKNNTQKLTLYITQFLKNFHWKNFSITLGISLIIAVIMGLYINAEWPWELHQSVVKERVAGKALMNAWAHLDKTDKLILQNKLAIINH